MKPKNNPNFKKIDQKSNWKKGISVKPELSEKSAFASKFLKYISANPLLLLILLISIVGIFIFKDYLLFKKFYIFKDIGSDTYNQGYPFYVHMANYLRIDGIPCWSFNVGMGQNIFPGGLNDPFSLILYAIGAKGIPYAIGYIELLKILTGGILFFLYLRTIKISKYVSIIGALCFAFSGFMIIGTEWYNFSTFFVYVAFTLLAFEKYFMEKKWYLLPIALMLLSTWLFLFYTFTIFFILYIIIRYTDEYEWNFKQFLFLSLQIALFYVLGIMLNSIIVLNGLIQTLNSPRVSGDAGLFNVLKLTPVFGLGEKLHNLTAILRLYSNDLAGTGSNFRGWYNYLEAPIFYSGLLSLLLLPQLFFSGSKTARIKYFGFFMLWFLIVLFPYFRHLYNLFSGDYYKASISFIVTLLLIYMSVKAFEKILLTGKINKPVLFITLIGLLVLLYLPYSGNLNNVIDKNLRNVIVVFLIIDAVCINFISFGKTKFLFKFLLLGAIIIELGYFGYIGSNKRMVLTAKENRNKIGYNDYSVEALAYLKSYDKGFYRINKTYFSGNAIHKSLNEAHIQNYYGTSSYMSFNNLSYINFLSSTDIIDPKNETSTRWAIGLLTRPLLQTLASIKYTLSKPDVSDYIPFGYQNIGTFGNVTLLKNQYFLPLGFTYDKYISFSQFKLLPSFNKDVALMKAMVINDKDLPLYNGLSSADMVADSILQFAYTYDEYGVDVQNRNVGAMTLSRHNQNLIAGDIVFDKRKLLFFSIPYDIGWKATIDGKPANLLSANVGFMGLLIEPGKHHIELKFTPPYLFSLMILTLLAFIIYFASLIIKPINKFLQFRV